MDVAQLASHRLAELSLDNPWPVRRSFEVALAVARQVRAQHDTGRWHGDIRLETIDISDDRQVRLRKSTSERIFGGSHSDLELCPPELVGDLELQLPADVRDANTLLKQSAFSLDARRIDVYQIGVVLCRLITGAAVRQYAESPRHKAAVPVEARDVLDRALGFDSPDRVQTCNALCDLLEAALQRLTHMDSGLATNTPAAGSLQTSDTDVGSDSVWADEDSVAANVPFERIAHFRLLELVGRGGMGEVYRARDEKLDRIVAVKILRNDLAADESFARRFQTEVDAIKRLPHPNLLPLYFTGVEHGRRFYVMRYVDGPSLAGRLRTLPALETEQAIDIALQCLSALAVAHDDGLIHRDIKPANVLLEEATGRAYLVDFGLARRIDDQQGLTRTGVVVGSVEYLSPEQARGLHEIDHRADLYSFGVMLYQMLSGRLPFTADSAVGWIFQHVHEPPTPLASIAPDLPRELSALVSELLAKDPDDRPPNCRAVIERLQPLQRTQARATQYTSELSMFLGDDDSLAVSPTIELPGVGDHGFVRRVCDRAATLIRGYSPKWIERWQTDEQQIDAAIAQHERRKRRLHVLQAEGHQLLQDLREQAKSLDNTSSTADAHALLQAQVGEIGEQVAGVDLQVAQVNAALLQLTSTRDALQARLKQAQPSSSARKRSTVRGTWIAALLVILAVGIPGAWTATPWLLGLIYPISEENEQQGGDEDSEIDEGTPLDADTDPYVQLVAGSLEALDAQVAAHPSDVGKLQQRSMWFALRHRWAEARQDLEAVLALQPDDLNTRIRLATICLFLEDESAYRTHGEYLRKYLTASTEQNVQIGIIATLCLDPLPTRAQELQVRLDVLDDAANTLPLLGWARPGVAYRTQQWQSCVTEAERMTGLQGPINLGQASLWLYRMLALYKLDRSDEAKRLLSQFKTFAARQTVESVTGGWFEEHPWSSRFEWLLYDGLRAQVLYREAARLMYGRSDSLEIPQVDFVRYAELFKPPVAPLPSTPEVANPLQAQVAEQILALGGKLQVQIVGSRSPMLVEIAATLPSVPFEVTSINLNQCQGVTRELLVRIGQLSSVQDVDLLATGVDDAAVAPLAKLTNLRSLGCGSSEVTGDCLAGFETLPSMNLLCFGGKFEGRNLVHFTKFPNLQKAYLGWTSLNDDDLQHIPPLSKMRHVLLERTKISGPGLAYLSRWPNIDDLALDSTELTDAGFTNLPPLPRLAKLRLDGNAAIGDASVPHLKRYPSLRSLNLKATNFTAAGLAELRAALPLCTIEHD